MAIDHRALREAYSGPDRSIPEKVGAVHRAEDLRIKRAGAVPEPSVIPGM